MLSGSRTHRVLDVVAGLLALAWWFSLVVSPLLLLDSILRVTTAWGGAGHGLTVPVRLATADPAVGELVATVSVTALPTGPAIVAATLWAATWVVPLLVIRPLRRIVAGLRRTRFDEDMARRVRRLAPIVAGVGVALFALELAASAVTAAHAPGAAVEIPDGPLVWGLVAAGVLIILSQVLVAATALQTDHDLTV